MNPIPPASFTSQRTLAVLALAAVAASFFFLLGRAPLFDVDEGAFSQATMEMFQRGDYLSTYLDGRPRYDKPILVYWLQAAAVALFGVSEFAFRLPAERFIHQDKGCSALRGYTVNICLVSQPALNSVGNGVVGVGHQRQCDAPRVAYEVYRRNRELPALAQATETVR